MLLFTWSGSGGAGNRQARLEFVRTNKPSLSFKKGSLSARARLESSLERIHIHTYMQVSITKDCMSDLSVNMSGKTLPSFFVVQLDEIKRERAHTHIYVFVYVYVLCMSVLEAEHEIRRQLEETMVYVDS